MKCFLSTLVLYLINLSSEERKTSDCSTEKVSISPIGYFCTYVKNLTDYIVIYVDNDFLSIVVTYQHQDYPNSFKCVFLINFSTPSVETLLIAAFSADTKSLMVTSKEENFIVTKNDFNKISRRLK